MLLCFVLRRGSLYLFPLNRTRQLAEKPSQLELVPGEQYGHCDRLAAENAAAAAPSETFAVGGVQQMGALVHQMLGNNE